MSQASATHSRALQRVASLLLTAKAQAEKLLVQYADQNIDDEVAATTATELVSGTKIIKENYQAACGTTGTLLYDFIAFMNGTTVTGADQEGKANRVLDDTGL